ncbi:hypothetical protein AKJ16_DCAP21611 [Drosera capensis]
MATPFQVATVVASPLYPNSIAWSEENLVAVAGDHIVTILNPDNPHGPRGVITLAAGSPFPVGVIVRKDLVNGCLLPTCLSRDPRPCARSIAWSPVGFSSNGGYGTRCLLAVCTTDGRAKLYRQPCCEYQSEWIEVIDVSELLYQYCAQTNYGETVVQPSLDSSDSAAQTLTESPTVVETSSLLRGCKRRRDKGLSSLEDTDRTNTATSVAEEIVFPSSDIRKASEVVGKTSAAGYVENLGQTLSAPLSRKKNSKNIPQDSHVQFITADQYAHRSALLASLVVAWSPLIQLSPTTADSSYGCWCLFAVGAKSGRVSIWKVQTPLSYSIEHGTVSPRMRLSGLISVQSTWITCLSWGMLKSESSNPQLLLATGGPAGTVKIWRGFATDFLRGAEAEPAPFCLLNEVVRDVPDPVVVLSLMVSVQPYKIVVAIGKGSGSFEVHTLDIKAKSLKIISSIHAHNCAMTGFAWSFDGRLLFSCSQDNSVRGWIIRKGALCEVSVPANILGTRLKARTDVFMFSSLIALQTYHRKFILWALPTVYDTCNGMAVSPGNLVIAVVRGFDPHALNPMYQARIMKASLEFFWIGGQQLSLTSNVQLKLDDNILSGFPEEDLVHWGSNILWSLNRFECVDHHLVVWDIIAASVAFQRCAPKFTEHVLSIWMSSLFDCPWDLSSKRLLPESSRSFSNISSRQLHLLSIVCRLLISPRVEDVNFTESYTIENEELWMELLLRSERELRARLVGFSFSTILHLRTHTGTDLQQEHVWDSAGIKQMLKWASLERDQICNRLDQLASEVITLFNRLISVKKRRQTKENSDVDERCSYCSAPVPFKSPEAGLCQGIGCDRENAQKHKLSRCCVSMQVCSQAPAWFCVCCQRRASRLAPEELFKLPNYPHDFGSFAESLGRYLKLKPSCPFCGILLQRLQPVFMLSASPV